ncbi:MAG: alpha-amylase family protein [Candidatus Promineifilaceae bacterium]|nr:alpha-amylase family protein [Candidatus Promineifilaceae bacterium]
MAEPNTVEMLEHLLDGPLRLLDPQEREIFRLRYEQYVGDVIRPLRGLYGQRDDFANCLYKFLDSVARAYAGRPRDMALLDLKRAFEPDWFQKSDMIGYVAYAERLAGTLRGVDEHIDYLKELGVRYLHLMPLLKPRPGNNDGGYAVMDYRQVRSELGSMADLRWLAQALRQEGISLCIDLVLNHTAKEHRWAEEARAGNKSYQDYYIMFPDREMPDQYEKTLPEIFPDFAPGNFTYYEEFDRWVWTTFNEFQWDLNYRNPAVFGEILEIMLYLANQGVEVLRLDAVAFMWKRLGTDSQNQPEVHWILQAFRALTRIAAPALLFKAEAIVAPDRLIPYLGRGAATNKECELAYNNSFMVLLWSTLATQKADLMTYSIQQMPETPSGATWITYVRGHDDIGWAVTDENAAAVGLSGSLHRAFLSDFYSGRFEGTFARGATFQYNPKTGDRRISGSLASLAGLETALAQQDRHLVELAVDRILLLHNFILAFGGIPVLYMGDELGLRNDQSYQEEPELADDNRWMHRPYMDWEVAERRHDWQSIEGRIYQGLQKLIATRRRLHAFHAEAATYAVWTHNIHVAGLIRMSPRGRLLILGNFSADSQAVPTQRLQELGFGGELVDHLLQQSRDGWQDLQLAPYQALWLQKRSDPLIEPTQE